MRAHIRPALVLLAFPVVTGVAYPAVVTAVAQLLFPRQANGSLIVGGRQDRRLVAHRPAVRRPEVLLEPSLGHEPVRLQRGRLVRVEPGPDQSRT